MQSPTTRTRFSPAACARAFGFALAVFATAAPVSAAPPSDAGERKAVIGQPVAVEVTPAAVTLNGVRDARQLVVTAKYADGSVRDITGLVKASVESAQSNPALIPVELQEGLYLRPKSNGNALIAFSADGKTYTVPVKVEGMDKPAPVSFRRDVIAAMNVGGCNAGACHGTPSGKNGFKLSLRGFEPAADFLQLTRDQFGRRTDKHSPEESLMLLKAIGRVPHEGGPAVRRGQRARRDDDRVAHRRAEGRRPDTTARHEGGRDAREPRAEGRPRSGNNFPSSRPLGM